MNKDKLTKEKLEIETVNTSNVTQRLYHYKQLGLKIQFYRKQHNMTQLQLAEKINISRTYLSNIEAPKAIVNPTLDIIFDIADALNVPVSLLFDTEKL